MPIIAKASGGNFLPAPPGTHSAVCCDVVDLGELKVSFGGKEKMQHKVAIKWQLGEDMPNGKPFIASKRYTLSLHEKSSLRKDLESWRGKKFTDAELEGFDLEVLLSIPALLNIIEEKKAGETYSNVASIMRLPKGMVALAVRDYVRMCERQTESMPVATSEMPDVPPPPASEYDRYHASDDRFIITDDDVPF